MCLPVHRSGGLSRFLIKILLTKEGWFNLYQNYAIDQKNYKAADIGRFRILYPAEVPAKVVTPERVKVPFSKHFQLVAMESSPWPLSDVIPTDCLGAITLFLSDRRPRLKHPEGLVRLHERTAINWTWNLFQTQFNKVVTANHSPKRHPVPMPRSICDERPSGVSSNLIAAQFTEFMKFIDWRGWATNVAAAVITWNFYATSRNIKELQRHARRNLNGRKFQRRRLRSERDRERWSDTQKRSKDDSQKSKTLFKAEWQPKAEAEARMQNSCNLWKTWKLAKT